jgi:hypothetical protein
VSPNTEQQSLILSPSICPALAAARKESHSCLVLKGTKTEFLPAASWSFLHLSLLFAKESTQLLAKVFPALKSILLSLKSAPASILLELNILAIVTTEVETKIIPAIANSTTFFVHVIFFIIYSKYNKKI